MGWKRGGDHQACRRDVSRREGSEGWTRHHLEVTSPPQAQQYVAYNSSPCSLVFLGLDLAFDSRSAQWLNSSLSFATDYTPYTRAFALDQLARKVVHDLRVSSLSTHPTVYSSARQAVFDTKDRLFASNHGEKDAVKGPELDYGFDERLRVNEIGPLLLGQQDQFKDFLHPNAIPGSYLWSDIMLYE